MISIFVSSCDKDFEKININPVLPSSLNPALLFANAQRESVYNTLRYESQIVQQVITPFTGVLQGGNHNVWFESNNTSSPFSSLYPDAVKLLTEVIHQTQEVPESSNLYNMARIMRSYVIQLLVDSYGDVPYNEAGRAFIDGIYLPEYDNDEDIYSNLLAEVVEATDGLSTSNPIESNELFFAGDIAKWKRFGNSLLLRIAMRYTKVNPTIAAQYAVIATELSRGGLMQSNADNVFIAFNSTFNNPNASQFQGTERANYYLAGPFVDYLQSTQDPRLEVIAVKYEFPYNSIGDTGEENTDPLDQQGMPIGYNESTIDTAPDYPGKIGAAWAYSQLNRRTLAKIDAPEFFMTYSQTMLLLAEAVHRGFVAGDANELYDTGVKAHMDQMIQFDESAEIPTADQDAYLASNPFNPASALEQINTQYWISSFLNGAEAWSNFRRSGFPDLAPNTYPNADPVVAGGFIRRFHYPAQEKSVNEENVAEAIARQGPDNMATRVFWDVAN